MMSQTPAKPKGTALVTGGTRGIGRALSVALARDGYSVIAGYARDREAAAELTQLARQEGLTITAVRADLRDPSQTAELVQAVRHDSHVLAAFVHAAASGVHKPVEKLTSKHLSWTLETNVVPVQDLFRELLPLMQAGSRILGITSSGATHALSCYAAVGASKAALEALFRHYARELAPQGIIVNLICPGLVETEGWAALPDARSRTESALRTTPTRRLTTPQDVAALAIFLCSESARQIVGQTIVVDGGHRLS